MPFMRKLKYQNIGLLTPITKIFWYILKDDKYQNPINVIDDYIPSEKFPTLKLHTNDIF